MNNKITEYKTNERIYSICNINDHCILINGENDGIYECSIYNINEIINKYEIDEGFIRLILKISYNKILVVADDNLILININN